MVGKRVDCSPQKSSQVLVGTVCVSAAVLDTIGPVLVLVSLHCTPQVSH
jgi:hypothetical protein